MIFARAIFSDTIASAFEGNAEQTPQLSALPDAKALALFGASRGTAVTQDAITPDDPLKVLGARIDQLAATIKQLSGKIDDL